MKQILTKTAIVCICVCTTFFLGGCNKLFDGSGYYTISGTFMDSCGGQRIPNRPLVVIYSHMVYPHPISNKVIGRGLADASGYFRISCERVNSGNITLVDTLTGHKYFTRPAPPSIDTAIQLGFIYTRGSTFKASVELHLRGAFSPDDTLFIGPTRIEYNYYYPVYSGMVIKDVFTYKYSGAISGISNQLDQVVHWGVGKANYVVATKELYVNAKLCEDSDTTTILILDKP